ncbi:MAG: UDP-N-acetylglucosamine diphosphorylase/glucosamine-1-phosphate N-acetyltransferase [Myxococcales bacterium]|nr:UDP-N-acetylglucosamine diphosphorylase/glucosamine-1-phosphate N-acetyltransferase [Myxococcales bacterium]
MKSAKAKVLHEVAGRPLIAWAVETAKAAGSDTIVAILGHQLEDVKGLLDDRYGEGKILIAHQKEQKGTGHAVLSALPALEGEPDSRTVVILTGDAPLLRAERVADLATACEASESKMALLSTVPPEAVAYGRLLRDESGKLLRIVEDADASDEQKALLEMNAGFYAINLGVLRAQVSNLTSDNAQGELYLTDLAEQAAERGGAAVMDAPFDEIAGINDRRDLSRVSASARERINEGWMREGVTFEDSSSTYVGADVESIGRDSILGAGVHLRGKTTVGEGVFIDAGCVVTDVSIDDGTWIRPYSVIAESKIGQRVQVGPFTHCRPNTVLDEESKVGNFVEIKKTHVMAGAKASHLSYLGDASIGAKANIGAGTITCNYDGFRKHKTTIEAGAFIGSDSQLVAPVTIGRDAFVGSGTTVTKDVPRSSLALSRSKQVNVEGWADRFREANEKRKR